MLMVPQVGQGALAVECRTDDRATRALLSAIDDAVVRRAVTAERAYLAELGGSCTLPVGAHATVADDDSDDSDGLADIELTGVLASDDGRVVLRHTARGNDPEQLGRDVARYLLDDCGGTSLGPWENGDGHGTAEAVP